MSVATSRDLDVDVVAWALALVLFGVGDVTTTVVGFSLGAIEANPFLDSAGPTILALGAGIVGWNLAVLGVLLP